MNVNLLEISGKMLLARYMKILDISASGVSLKADRRLNIGSEYSLRIEGMGKILQLKGTVIWSLLGESIETPVGAFIPVYKAGMSFMDVNEDKIDEIGKFIDLYRQEVTMQHNFNHADLGLELLALQEKKAEELLQHANIAEISSSFLVDLQSNEYMS